MTEAGAAIVAFDPKVKSLPAGLKVVIASTAADALRDADAAVIATEWPEFRTLGADDFKGMARPLILDQSRFLQAQLSGKAGLEYFTTGRAA
jgi:UDPglucose 6-dehydrogenase